MSQGNECAAALLLTVLAALVMLTLQYAISPPFFIPCNKEVFFIAEKNSLSAELVINEKEDYRHFLQKILTRTIQQKIKAGENTAVIAVTGGYTDKFGRPVGLTFSNGRMVTEKIEKWDGFVKITKSGNISIEEVGSFSFSEGVSGFQTHLIIDKGENQVSANAPNQRAHRRSIILNSEGKIGLIDSEKIPLSLFEWSELLISKYAAKRAVNLDMGAYNLCLKTSSAGTDNCSNLESDPLLSNAIVFTVKNSLPACSQ